MKLYSPAEVAEITGFHRQVIYRAIRRGELPAFRLCQRIRVRQNDLENWIEGEPIKPAPRETSDAMRTTRVSRNSSVRLVRDR
jgi:excisionase family DNA binding protein